MPPVRAWSVRTKVADAQLLLADVLQLGECVLQVLLVLVMLLLLLQVLLMMLQVVTAVAVMLLQAVNCK